MGTYYIYNPVRARARAVLCWRNAKSLEKEKEEGHLRHPVMEEEEAFS